MMKKILAFTLALILIFPSWMSWGATDEGYGEDEQALGQFVDSFETSDNVSIMVQVIRNATLEAMELNYSGASAIYEDFTSFTEVDGGGDLTVTPFEVSWNTMIRNVVDYVWRDDGAGHFGDFEANYTLNWDDIEAGDSTSTVIMGAFSVANSAGTVVDLVAGDALTCMFLQISTTDDIWRPRLWQYTGGVRDFVVFGNIRQLGTYYCTLTRSGTTITWRIYNDEARTVLLDTITDGGNGDGTAYRYVNVAQSFDSTQDPNDHSTGYIANLTFGVGGGYNPNGYFTTVDYISDPVVNGSALVALMNTTIPYNTQILVEFSEDNITWVFNDWQPLFGGFESVDLRDLNYSTGFYYRYNLSTTDASLTPRVYQNRLITTIGNATGGAGVPPAVPTNWGLLWFIFILICIPIALVLLKGSR